MMVRRNTSSAAAPPRAFEMLRDLRESLRAQSRMLRCELGAHDLAFFLGAFAAARLGGELLSLAAQPVTLAWLSSIAARGSFAALEDAIDHENDRNHPARRPLSVAAGAVTPRAAVLWWVALSCFAVALACEVNPLFAAIALPAWFLGSAHAASPVKGRQVAALRVIGPMLRLPLHLALGWCALGAVSAPPLLLLLGVWTLGAFLSTIARLAEACRSEARRARVDARSHLAKGVACAVGYGLATTICAAFVTAALRLELVLVVPFAAALGAYVLARAVRHGQAGLALRGLVREPVFLALVVTGLAVLANAVLSDIPALVEWSAAAPLLL
jgi:4-hydroxybenzoate polyprenyltransferase